MINEIIKRVHNLTVPQQKELLDYLDSLQNYSLRGYPRKKAAVAVDAVVGNRVLQTHSIDISASGIYIQASGKFQVDADARVLFSIPGAKTPFKFGGKIIRVDQEGISIKFEGLNAYMKETLDKLIWKGSE